MIDFAAKVLGPCMNVFARPIIITPVKSKPDAPEPYMARGIWALKGSDHVSEDGALFAVDEWSVGIRGTEFEVVPVPGDHVEIPAHGSQPAIPKCVIDDDGYDGQGGYKLILKLLNP